MSDPVVPEPRHVLGVGIATLDIVNEVAWYPPEDEEVRALAQFRRRGGNVANTLALLRQLGHVCAWIGPVADDDRAAEILDDLQARGIDTRSAVQHCGSLTPTSYVTSSVATGSRTIVHFRDLPELTAADFARTRLDRYDWVHFEGRNPTETAQMLRDCARRHPGLPVSLEVEKSRPGIELLFAGPRVLIYSRTYAHSCGFDDPTAFLDSQWSQTSADLLLLPWGAAGAYGQARGTPPCFAPGHPPLEVMETLGAGDVFNAAAIDGMLSGMDLDQLLARANRLAGHKCGRRGLDGVAQGAREAGLL